MSLLQDISISVQQVAEAISIAVGVEVEIVDSSLTIITVLAGNPFTSTS